MEKHCSKCDRNLPLSEFGKHRYVNTYCKRCDVERTSYYRKRRRESETDEPEDEYEVTEELAPSERDHLYIITNPKIAGESKIGRSKDVNARSKELSRCQNFSAVVHHTYTGQGFLEAVIHRRLAKIRVTDGDGREWFHTDPETAHIIVSGIIAEASLGCI